VTAFQTEPSLNQQITAADELGAAELDAVNGGSVKGGSTLMTSVLTNIANMRHEMLKSIANNLRG
jgi:hypothetical protein